MAPGAPALVLFNSKFAGCRHSPPGGGSIPEIPHASILRQRANRGGPCRRSIRNGSCTMAPAPRVSMDRQFSHKPTIIDLSRGPPTNLAGESMVPEAVGLRIVRISSGQLISFSFLSDGTPKYYHARNLSARYIQCAAAKPIETLSKLRGRFPHRGTTRGYKFLVLDAGGTCKRRMVPFAAYQIWAILGKNKLGKPSIGVVSPPCWAALGRVTSNSVPTPWTQIMENCDLSRALPLARHAQLQELFLEELVFKKPLGPKRSLTLCAGCTEKNEVGSDYLQASPDRLFGNCRWANEAAGVSSPARGALVPPYPRIEKEAVTVAGGRRNSVFLSQPTFFDRLSAP